MEGETLNWLVTMERGGVFTMDADWEKFVWLIHLQFGQLHEIVGVPEPLDAISGETIPEAPKEHTKEEILNNVNDEEEEMQDDLVACTKQTIIPKPDPTEATDHIKFPAAKPVDVSYHLFDVIPPLNSESLKD
jgi:hypothetical protein